MLKSSDLSGRRVYSFECPNCRASVALFISRPQCGDTLPAKCRYCGVRYTVEIPFGWWQEMDWLQVNGSNNRAWPHTRI